MDTILNKQCTFAGKFNNVLFFMRPKKREFSTSRGKVYVYERDEVKKGSLSPEDLTCIMHNLPLHRIIPELEYQHLQ